MEAPTQNNHPSTTLPHKSRARDFANHALPFFGVQHWKAGSGLGTRLGVSSSTFLEVYWHWNLLTFCSSFQQWRYYLKTQLSDTTLWYVVATRCIDAGSCWLGSGTERRHGITGTKHFSVSPSERYHSEINGVKHYSTYMHTPGLTLRHLAEYYIICSMLHKRNLNGTLSRLLQTFADFLQYSIFKRKAEMLHYIS